MKIAIARILILALLTVVSVASSVYALNPKHEAEFHSAVAALEQSVHRLNGKLSEVFQPGAAEDAAGLEEIAWRMRDLAEKTQKISSLCKDYWKNEAAVVGLLDQWGLDAKAMDEAMVYTAASKEISDVWKASKAAALKLRDYAEEIPSQEEFDKVWNDFHFDIVKVGRFAKKQVLREKFKEFIGGDDLDKWPFPDEKRDLNPKEFGEHYMVTFKLKPKSGVALSLPLKLRFEVKFAKHTYDTSEQMTFANLKGGSHDFTFKNVGDDFANRGKVIHWRASLLLHEKVVAQKKSPMWTVVSEWAQK